MDMVQAGVGLSKITDMCLHILLELEDRIIVRAFNVSRRLSACFVETSVISDLVFFNNSRKLDIAYFNFILPNSHY